MKASAIRRRRIMRAGGRRKSRRAKGIRHASVCGYAEGNENGYAAGMWEGINQYSVPFPGTSIIIPTMNQKNLLRQCIESIFKHTPEPIELIVVDNGSEDGTADYLHSMRGRIRFRLNEMNLGFAGAINQGLMMSKGKTIVLLNNDTIVTAKWLANLLVCVNGCPNAGLIGPVTNYISGEQLIPTSYESIEQMHAFARAHNVSDPAMWQQTSRLTGFCLAMKRDVFERIGFWDEGFKIGNFEDDDYGLRARLLGLELTIAKDTFIHHHGSVSIKALGTGLERVNAHNSRFYTEKWTDIRVWFPLYMAGCRVEARTSDAVFFFPTNVLVQGTGDTVYWVENGLRRPLQQAVKAEAARLSQLDLRRWPVGPPVTQEYVAQAIRTLDMYAVFPSEGMLVKTPNGYTYQVKGEKLHRIASAWTLEFWKLSSRHIYSITEEERGTIAEGLPIIASAVIRARNL